MEEMSQTIADQSPEKPSRKKMSRGRLVGYAILILALLVLAVQYINAARYDMLVQVIKEDKIGVNPTGERLDFGDLPHDKDAVRVVTLRSAGRTPTYVIVWTRGEIADFVKVSKNSFTLEPGKNERLEFSIHIPNSADFRYYRGKVIIFQVPKIW